MTQIVCPLKAALVSSCDYTLRAAWPPGRPHPWWRQSSQRPALGGPARDTGGDQGADGLVWLKLLCAKNVSVPSSSRCRGPGTRPTPTPRPHCRWVEPAPPGPALQTWAFCPSGCERPPLATQTHLTWGLSWKVGSPLVGAWAPWQKSHSPGDCPRAPFHDFLGAPLFSGYQWGLGGRAPQVCTPYLPGQTER